MQKFNSPPVSQGEELDIHIEAVGEKGDGVAKIKGFVLFIPNTQAGEDCRVRITKVLQKVGFAEKIGSASEPVQKQEFRPQNRGIPVIESEPEPEDSEDFGEEEEE